MGYSNKGLLMCVLVRWSIDPCGDGNYDINVGIAVLVIDYQDRKSVV